jgi:hypothetical protein
MQPLRGIAIRSKACSGDTPTCSSKRAGVTPNRPHGPGHNLQSDHQHDRPGVIDEPSPASAAPQMLSDNRTILKIRPVRAASVIGPGANKITRFRYAGAIGLLNHTRFTCFFVISG